MHEAPSRKNKRHMFPMTDFIVPINSDLLSLMYPKYNRLFWLSDTL